MFFIFHLKSSLLFFPSPFHSPLLFVFLAEKKNTLPNGVLLVMFLSLFFYTFKPIQKYYAVPTGIYKRLPFLCLETHTTKKSARLWSNQKVKTM